MIKLLFVPFFVFSTTVFASCDNLYPSNKRVVVLSALELCNRQYVSVYDAKLHRNMFSSELITENKTRVDRTNNFKIDQRVPYVKPSDYTHSGYDRGHMAPAGNSNDDIAMDESFLMTNMTPQAPNLNRGVWNKLEQQIRKEVKGSYHVVTGAAYEKSHIMIGPNKNIPVPTGYFKCVVTTKTICYYANNTDNAVIETIDIKQANKLAGIRIFK